jgi:uncharacterized OsmC-like protein
MPPHQSSVKKVAVVRGTDPHIFLVRALLTAGMTERDMVAVLVQQHADGGTALIRSQTTCRARAIPNRPPSISSSAECSPRSTARSSPTTPRPAPRPARRYGGKTDDGGRTTEDRERSCLLLHPSSVLRRPRRCISVRQGVPPMDALALRSLQSPLKERYKSDPKAAVITLKARGTLDDVHIACKVETGRALAVAGLHPATGGSGLELCSGDMLLEALVACAGVTLKAVATAIEVPLKSGTVSAEGDLDFRGTLGVAKDAPVGFARIRLRFDIESDAPQEKLDQLLKLTERYCVVYQTLKSGPPLEVAMHRA